MFSRFGLRVRMAASYVAVSAAAVLVVETVLLIILVPRFQAARDSVAAARQSVLQAETGKLQSKAREFATGDAAAVAAAVEQNPALPAGAADGALLAQAAEHGYGASGGSAGSGPAPTASTDGQSAASGPQSEVTEVLATPDGVAVATSAPQVYAIGSALPAAAVTSPGRTDVMQVKDRVIGWATSPVAIATGSGRRVIGFAYAQVDVPASAVLPSALQSGRQDLDLSGLLLPGVIILALLLPVGGLFGLLSTRRLIRRIQRLAEGASAMAGGDLGVRIGVRGRDEVGRLEGGFNSMAEQLEVAVGAARETAAAAGRRAERTRIARELHDSISQDLFSLNLLAGGLRRGLPDGSGLRHQAESMERTLDRTMREMRVMLLELRPVDLEDIGLAAALDGLCREYEVRLGVRINSDIGELRLEPKVEHAVLRVVQEALGNAVRHGRPGAIDLQVCESEGKVTVLVRDDGQGFDEARIEERRGMGLRLMRERVGELDGTVDVTSAPQRGTTVRVRIPVGTA
jgi:signal transduction histidine kinase